MLAVLGRSGERVVAELRRPAGLGSLRTLPGDFLAVAASASPFDARRGDFAGADEAVSEVLSKTQVGDFVVAAVEAGAGFPIVDRTGDFVGAGLEAFSEICFVARTGDFKGATAEAMSEASLVERTADSAGAAVEAFSDASFVD